MADTYLWDEFTETLLPLKYKYTWFRSSIFFLQGGDRRQLHHRRFEVGGDVRRGRRLRGTAGMSIENMIVVMQRDACQLC